MIKPRRIESPKLKQCKNPGCINKFMPANSLVKVCGTSCALSLARLMIKKKEERLNKKHLQEFNRKDVRWQHKQCQPVFNRLRRLQEFKWFKDRGMEPVCISCGGPEGGDKFCNGHFKTVGSSAYLRYDLKNSYLQHNYRCNSILSGDIAGTATTHGYKQGLINRFGEAEAGAIMDYCERFAAVVHRFEWQDLERMRKEWNKEIRELEKYLNDQ